MLVMPSCCLAAASDACQCHPRDLPDRRGCSCPVPGRLPDVAGLRGIPSTWRRVVVLGRSTGCRAPAALASRTQLIHT